jgi:hypothetical protein
MLLCQILAYPRKDTLTKKVIFFVRVLTKKVISKVALFFLKAPTKGAHMRR